MTSTSQTQPIAPGLTPPRRSTFAALQVPHYPRLWASGVLWNMTRWMAVFLSAYLVNHLTHSPFLVQLVGSAYFAPMFFGGILGGVISDRFDRRRTILTQLAVLMPIAVLMGVVVLSGGARAWTVYPFILAVGFGGVIDMTSRRALVYDFVGEERITNALALETMSGMAGNMLGALTAGLIISTVGIGQAFLMIAACYAASFVLLLGVPKLTKPASASKGGVSVLRELRAGFAYVRAERSLVSVLGVTVLMNLFYWPFMPLVPTFAEKLDVGAFWAGLLASAAPFGSMIGTFLIARGLPITRGQTYIGGSMIGLVFLFLFAASPFYATSFLALACAGAGLSGFTTMQSVLMLTSSTPEMRGRAMGMMSTAIGALPFGMLVLGAVAELVGPAAGVMGSVAVGFVVMTLWSLRRPEALRLP